MIVYFCELIECNLYLTRAIREERNGPLTRIGREGKGAETGEGRGSKKQGHCHLPGKTMVAGLNDRVVELL